ncbi:ankyrin repeat domain-containing protein [bacterium]|nr:ankyrin repeat domain-containing protein [bacterium]
MPLTTQSSLSADELDDLIYHARTGDLVALRSTISNLSALHSSTPSQIINTAIDSEPEEPSSGSGCCLLHWPAANGNQEVLKYLLSLLDINADEAEGAAGALTSLVDHKNNSGNTPLHWAAVNAHLSCVQALIAAGADPAVTNSAGHDALYEADCSSKDGGQEVAQWILANCPGLEKAMKSEAGGRESVSEKEEDVDDSANDQ